MATNTDARAKLTAFFEQFRAKEPRVIALNALYQFDLGAAGKLGLDFRKGAAGKVSDGPVADPIATFQISLDDLLAVFALQPKPEVMRQKIKSLRRHKKLVEVGDVEQGIRLWRLLQGRALEKKFRHPNSKPDGSPFP